MAFFADQLPDRLQYFFNRRAFVADAAVQQVQGLTAMRLNVLAIWARFKFFGFARIVCGFLYAVESRCQAGEEWSRADACQAAFPSLMQELWQFWLFPLPVSAQSFSDLAGQLRNSMPAADLHSVETAFYQALTAEISSTRPCSLVRLYRLWVKKLDQYTRKLLRYSLNAREDAGSRDAS